jgi:hypothetical protein
VRRWADGDEKITEHVRQSSWVNRKVKELGKLTPKKPLSIFEAPKAQCVITFPIVY